MTHNQIAYIQARQNYQLESAKQTETRRYNLVQEELKRIDQELQKDLQRINKRYQDRSLKLQEHDLALKERIQDRSLQLQAQELALKERIQNQQLINERSRLEIQREGNALNSQTIAETARANKVRETLNTLELNAKLPQYSATADATRAQSANTRAQTSLTQAKIKSEQTVPKLHKSQTFSNYASPFINLGTSILRTVSPLLVK